MKNLTFFGKIAILIFAAVMLDACQSPIIQDDELSDELVLKSVSISAKSYIVQLDDVSIISELGKIKTYQGRKEKLRGLALGIMKKNGLSGGGLGFVYSNSIIGFSVKIAPGQLKKLAADSSVKFIEKDKVIILRPGKGKPNNNTPPVVESIPWGITRVGGGISGEGKTVWIIDTGIDLDHPDLNVDEARGVNFSSDKKLDDANGHGSHVAGTIAAIDNEIGVVGVAAGATVIPVKVLSRRGSGSYSGVIAGIDYVAGNAAPGDVANMSLGGGVSTSLDNAVIAAAATGVKFVLAAGNESDDANNHSPARANGPNIYTVSAMDNNDVFAYFSNYSNPPIDYCAPGVSIYSTYKGGGYATLSGTSMAAPHVAGLLLLGVISADGYVVNDPDGDADPIAHH